MATSPRIRANNTAKNITGYLGNSENDLHFQGCEEG
jgi:hypothetical protein